MTQKILLAGPQGSGKTTQAKIISGKLNLALIKTGDLIRHKVAEDNPEFKALKEIVDAGKLIPIALTSELVRQAVDEHDNPEGFIIDGYPRTLGQLGLYDPKFTQVVFLRIPEEVGIERLMKRGRRDDTPEGIKARLTWYHQETEPLLEHYRQQGLLIEVDGTADIDHVTENIITALREHPNGSHS